MHTDKKFNINLQMCALRIIKYQYVFKTSISVMISTQKLVNIEKKDRKKYDPGALLVKAC